MKHGTLKQARSSLRGHVKLLAGTTERLPYLERLEATHSRNLTIGSCCPKLLAELAALGPGGDELDKIDITRGDDAVDASDEEAGDPEAVEQQQLVSMLISFGIDSLEQPSGAAVFSMA